MDSSKQLAKEAGDVPPEREFVVHVTVELCISAESKEAARDEADRQLKSIEATLHPESLRIDNVEEH